MYQIANLSVSIESPGSMTAERGKQYMTSASDVAPDIVIPFDTRPMPEYAKTTEDEEAVTYLREGNKFYKQLLHFDGFMMHASAVVVGGNAYLFSGPSGMGKSTHTGLWLKKFGERAYILNDDKPAIRLIDGTVFAFGTPWSGKNDLSRNIGVPIRGICFLEQDTSNWIRKMDTGLAAIRFFHATIKFLDKNEMSLLTALINTVVSKVPVFQMGCLPDTEAVEMSYRFMKGDI